MAMIHRPISAVLIYVLSPCLEKVLLVHRNKRESDDQLGFYNGLGGKLEAGETLIECMQRELLEEAAIIPTLYELKGIIHWEGFGKERESWLGHVYLVSSYQGTPLRENVEGTLAFHSIDSLPHLNIFEGDRIFLDQVFDSRSSPFYAHLTYDDKKFIHGRIH